MILCVVALMGHAGPHRVLRQRFDTPDRTAQLDGDEQATISESPEQSALRSILIPPMLYILNCMNTHALGHSTLTVSDCDQRHARPFNPQLRDSRQKQPDRSIDAHSPTPKLSHERRAGLWWGHRRSE